MPGRFELVGPECDMELLARRGDIEPSGIFFEQIAYNFPETMPYQASIPRCNCGTSRGVNPNVSP